GWVTKPAWSPGDSVTGRRNGRRGLGRCGWRTGPGRWRRRPRGSGSVLLSPIGVPARRQGKESAARRIVMNRVIVIEFGFVDGVIQDPDGNEGSPHGGWAFRYGPEPVTGDPFALGEVLGTGALLLGRRTWEMFAKIWPGRDDPFSAKMNAMPKLVASRSLVQ